MDDMQKVNQWFLDNEGISYEEFCKIYNNGQRLEDFRFLNLPEEILEILDPYRLTKNNIPIKLVDFLKLHNILDEYLININKYSKSAGVSKAEMIRRMQESNVIDRSMRWSDTPQGYNFWYKLNKEYLLL